MPFRTPGPLREGPSDAAATAGAYLACATGALQLTRFDGGFAIVWLATAALFARLATVPRRRWIALALACLPGGIAASAVFGVGGPSSLVIGSLGVAEAYAAARLLRRLCPRFGRFASVGEVGRFLGVAGLLVPASSAVLAALSVHLLRGQPFWPAWRDWYAGHALGLVAFAPPLLLLMRGEVGGWIRSAGRGQTLEATMLLLAVAGATALTFGQSRVPLVTIPIVPMLACTFRLGRFGAIASIAILIAIGMPCSLAGLGPTALLPVGMSLKFQVLQLYFATIVLILLPVAAELKARRRLLDRLQGAEALHRLILDRTSDIVLRSSPEGIVHYASPAVARVWGFAPEEIVGRSLFGFVVPDDVAAVRDARRRALVDPDETAAAEYRVTRRDGAPIWVESHIRATQAEDGAVTGTVSILREVTERRRQVEDLARKATLDPLTGLFNRRAFDDALAARAGSAAAALPACLAIFDLDHFKQINDRHGHGAGDAVLRRFAAMLRGSLRDDDIVARLGGEEFAVLLAGVTPEQAAAVCERIRRRLAEAEIAAGTAMAVRATVSVGLAPLGPDGGIAGALAAADAALYRAKDAGRNRLMLAAGPGGWDGAGSGDRTRITSLEG